MTYSTGTLLGGKVRYRQMIDGHRSGLEPVLLAASVPARPGERVVEAGTGAGAGLLCLSHRVANLTGLGIDRDPALARLAADNFEANERGSLMALAADVARLPLRGQFDHGFANPPWHSLLNTASPDMARQRAHRAEPGLLATWATALGRLLRPGGSLTFIIPASSIGDCLAAMAMAQLGACRIMPFWPRTGQPAKLVIIRARKQDGGPASLCPGLVLHDRNGFTREADAVLRDGIALLP